MAEFLVKAIDATNKDAVKDLSGCHKRGDVVVVVPNGHEWGKEERLPKFVVVKVPEMTVKEAEKYTESEKATLVPNKITTLIKRKYRLRIDSFPQLEKEALEAQGIAEMSKVQVESFMTDKAL